MATNSDCSEEIYLVIIIAEIHLFAYISTNELGPNMNTIKILIAAPAEMHDEVIRFSELIANLNEVLEPRGIELRRVKWDPESDGSIEEFKSKLSGSEMCLTLYWKSLAGNSQQELDAAYDELKKGNNPQRLYVFFKEPSADITESLKEFKASFVNRYGHFFCKFENADTMNLHFILQFEAYNNQPNNDLVKVADGKVVVGGKEMVYLKNIPFAAMNKEYQRLQKELSELDEEIADTSIRYAANTKDRELLKQLSSLSSKREKVGEEFEKYQTHLYNIALTFAKLSGEHSSERMRKARELFEKGSIVEADQVLNMEEMKREARHELELHEQNIRNLETKIEEFRLKADTSMANTSLAVPDRFAEACEAYEEAISIAREIHFDKEKFALFLYEYAYLLQKFNRTHEAVSLYQEALEHYRTLAETNPNAYLSDVAAILNNLGNLQRDLGLNADAEESYQEALAIYRTLAAENPDVYLSDVAMTLNNLGNLQRDFGRHDDAEKSYQEALGLFRSFATENPDTFLSNVAKTLNNLGSLQHDLGRYDDAEKSYQEALGISRTMAEKNPDTYLSDVAMTLHNLGVLQKDLCRYDDSENSYQEALGVYRTLAAKNPDAFLSDVAMTLNNLGNLQRNLGRYDDAEKSYQEALEIRRRLAATNPDVYLSDEARTLNHLGFMQYDLGQYEDAEQSYQEELEIRRRLAATNPDVYLSDVAETLNNLGVTKNKLGRYDDAETSFQEALDILRKITTTDSDTHLSDEARTLYNLGYTQYDLGQYEDAEQNYKEALEIRRRLAATNPATYLSDVAKTLLNLGILSQRIYGRHDEAEKSYQEALGIYRNLAAENPDTYLSSVAKTFYSLGVAHYDLKKTTNAIGSWEEALQIYRQLNEKKPGLYDKEIKTLVEWIQYIHGR